MDWDSDLRDEVCSSLESGLPSRMVEALDAVRSLPLAQRGQPMRIGVCATFSIEPLVPALELGLSTVAISPELVIAEFDNIHQSLLDRDSVLHRSKMDAVLVLWQAKDLLAQLQHRDTQSDVDQRQQLIDDALDDIRSLVEGYLEITTAPVFLPTLSPDFSLATDLRSFHEHAGVPQAIAQLNLGVLRLAADNPGVRILDLAGWWRKIGTSGYNMKMDMYARQPIAQNFTGSFAQMIAEHLRPLTGKTKKVLAIDLDNTLWGGVLGEDGVAGLAVGHDFPGKIYMRIQELVRDLRVNGVVLILLTKNNHSDVVEAFAKRSDMPLRLDDFTVVMANWEAKHENLLVATESIGLSLDSVVFLDDQAFEREAMLFHLPDVTVPDVGADPLAIIDILINNPWFQRYRLTDADRNRTADYTNNAKRQALRASSGSLEDFLFGLGLRLQIDEIDDVLTVRAAQMCARTNQFNLTMRRHDESAISGMRRDERNILFIASLADKFGDQGAIGLCIGIADDTQQDVIEIDSFLMSCRALGRGIEQAMFYTFVERAVAAGYGRIHAKYVPGKRNQQCEEFFETQGMAVAEDGSDGKRYTLSLPADVIPPAWIEITADGNKGSRNNAGR
ncbi:MAG: HAD-IIIC family phosphatase [Rhodospirillales bacterium]